MYLYCRGSTLSGDTPSSATPLSTLSLVLGVLANTFVTMCPKFFLIAILALQADSALSQCTCVPFYQCSDDDNSIISDGQGLLDIRKHNKCEGVFEVCCNTTTTSTTTEPSKPRKGCGYHDKTTYQWSSSLLFKQYPYIVPSYKCRIALIHPQVAITAAHCLEEKGFYLAKVGNATRAVAQTIIHPQFNEASLQNDLAVLVLGKPFKAGRAAVVCLPPPETVVDGQVCATATRTDDDGDSLRVISAPIVLREDCVTSLRRTRLGRFFQLHGTFLCAGGDEDRDVCGGDGGSPLICPVPGLVGRFQQVGVVSWGIGCGQKVPGVYVSVAQFRDWIDGVVAGHGFDINTYRL